MNTDAARTLLGYEHYAGSSSLFQGSLSCLMHTGCTAYAHGKLCLGDMDMVEKRTRRWRTFTMADESYALLTQYEKVATTPRTG